MILNSDIVINELGFFEEVRRGVFEARRGNSFHDDTVTTAYWASYCLRSRFFEDFLHYVKKNEPNSEVAQMNVNTEELSDEDIMNSFFGGTTNEELSFFQNDLGKI